MSALQFRVAREQDIDAVVAMLNDDFLGGTREDPAARDGYRAALAEMANHPHHDLYVATRDGGIVGMLELSFFPGISYQGAWRAQVESVRIRGDLRGSGLGSEMMQWVIERARERNCILIQLSTNVAREDAQRFYKKLGFKASHVGMKLML